MSGFNLDNYKTVPERMTEAYAKYPAASLQSEVVTLPAAFADKYVAVKARFFRTPDDPAPGEGLAWELVPGKTPYTKDSELMNAETSAWGRAIVAAFAADTQKGIASREEVERQAPKRKGRASDLFEPSKPEPRQTATRATETPPEPQNGEPDLAAKQWSARLKLNLVEAYDGDKEEARTMWVGILKSHGYGADDYVKPEDRETIEQDVAIALLPVEQAPFL